MIKGNVNIGLVAMLGSMSILAGCIATAPPITNPSGQPIKFVEPILGKADAKNARYVLIEKSISDGKYRLISISKSRQPITNERQERIAFSDDLTRFAPDFVEYRFQTYTDRAGYGQQTVIMECVTVPLKTVAYSPCNSEFAGIFVPSSAVSAYVAGRMSDEVHYQWTDPKKNRLRLVRSPQGALRQAGVFERMAELATPIGESR